MLISFLIILSYALKRSVPFTLTTEETFLAHEEISMKFHANGNIYILIFFLRRTTLRPLVTV